MTVDTEPTVPPETLAELEVEHRAIRRQTRGAMLITVGTLLAGALFYHFVQRLSWVDALYFCTITLTTIGYGDIVPRTDAEKLFTVFYVLVGIGILGFFVNILIRNAVLRRQLRRAKRSSRHGRKLTK